MTHYPVPHKYYIHARDMNNKLPYPTGICGTYGQMPMHEGGRWRSTHQDLTKTIPHTHVLHSHRVVDTPARSIGKLYHMDWGDLTGDGDYHQPHYSGIHILHMQSQEDPRHHLHTHPFRTTNHMDSLNISPGSFPPREILTPKDTNPHHSDQQNGKIGGTKHL